MTDDLWMMTIPPLFASVDFLRSFKQIIPLAGALQSGGIRAIKINFPMPTGCRIISQLRERFPDMLIGAGMAATPRQLEQVRDAGAHLTFSDRLDPETYRCAVSLRHLHIPSIASLRDAQEAFGASVRLVGINPVTSHGMPANLIEVCRNLGIYCCPSGNITMSELITYSATPFVASMVMSSFAAGSLVATDDWPRVEANAATACANLRSVHSNLGSTSHIYANFMGNPRSGVS